MDIALRHYNQDRDRDAAHRIWREVGWLEDGDEQGMDWFVEAGTALVADLDGQAEALVLSAPGTLRHLAHDVPFAGVTGVTCSRIARKRGLARRLTAQLIAQAATDGAAMAGLGMFEQGFYDQLGFGSGCYDLYSALDPAQLMIDLEPRVPRRLDKSDFFQMHAGRLARRRWHGSITLTPADLTRAELLWGKEGFGMGYWDDDGHLTHHFWCNAKDEHGPYDVEWLVFQTGEQFLELMALLQSIGDQVHCIRLLEPPGFQLQDLIRQPHRWRRLTEKGTFNTFVNGEAGWQVRICSLETCLAATHLACEPVRFNLRLTDPIAPFLDAESPWQGVGGEYIVTLGPESQAHQGSDSTLPTVETTVNAFSRLWLGIRPASSLAITDRLRAPASLLAALDQALRLPQPSFDWSF
jgi:hypothetical protein